MQTNGQQLVLFQNKLSCAWQMQEVISNNKSLKEVRYVTMYVKHAKNTTSMQVTQFFNKNDVI
jgi:heme-binding NEAT domain protein